jgi:hypothetical protein
MFIERRCRPILSLYLGCNCVMGRNIQMASSRGAQSAAAFKIEHLNANFYACLRSEKTVCLDGRFLSYHAGDLIMKR